MRISGLISIFVFGLLAISINSSDVQNYLFIGNSFTFVNKLPVMFAGLAKVRGHLTDVSFVGIGAASFQSLFKNPELATHIYKQKWNTIIMQEQSMFLSQAPFIYKQTSVPWAKELYNMFLIKNSTERVCLFETWAYQNGNPSFLTGLDDNYKKMQSRLFNGYNYTLETLRNTRKTADPEVILSPVGEAWSIAQADPRFKGLLWQQDGIHPKPHGTYLAACVFYSVLFQESPVNNSYRPKGINKNQALALQRIAANFVQSKN